MFRPTLAIGFATAVIAALVQSFFVPIDCDVSWLITVNEKMLAGQRLYVDIVEVNPPASIWLYTPFVWLAHALHLRPEAVVATAFIAGALATSALALRISAHLRSPPNPLVFFALLCFVELLLPLGTFAQREHAAILFAAPALTALAVLAEKRPLSLSLRVIAGLAAGLVIAIKPHFALAIVPAVALAAWQARTLRPMVPAAAAALAVVALYAAAVLVFTPEYLQLLPMLSAAYLPLHDYWLTLLRGPVVIVPLAIYALALFLRPGRVAALPAMFLIASAGFAVAGLIQGKGYLNHALPGMALGFVGLVLLPLEPGIERGRRNFVLAATAALACLELYAMASIQPIPGLAEAVTASPRRGRASSRSDPTSLPATRLCAMSTAVGPVRARACTLPSAPIPSSRPGTRTHACSAGMKPTSMLSPRMCSASGRTSSWSMRAPRLHGCVKSRRFKA